MGNTNLGFHATIDEILIKTKSATSKYNLTAIMVKLWPEFTFEIMDQSTISDVSIKSARFVFLCKENPAVLSKNYNTFLSENKENLVLQIGERTEQYMKESTIGTRATDPENIRLWKKVISIFKKDMHQGAWIIDPRSSARKYYRNHYFSIGAQHAYERGVKMKALAGLSEYQLSVEHPN